MRRRRKHHVKGILFIERGRSKAFYVIPMKRAMERIHVINNGRCSPATEHQPRTVSCCETFHIRGGMCVTEHRIELSTFSHVSLCFWCLGGILLFFFCFFFPAVCSAQQTRFSLLWRNLRVSSDGRKSNSGTFCLTDRFGVEDEAPHLDVWRWRHGSICAAVTGKAGKQQCAAPGVIKG